jgi:hypothetical protein
MTTPTQQEIAALIEAADSNYADPYELIGKMADALEALSAERDHKPVSDAPKGRYLLLLYPPDGKTILTPRWGVGCYTSDLGLCDWEWSMPPKFYYELPSPPQEDKEEAAS